MIDSKYLTLFNKFKVSEKDLKMYESIISEAMTYERIESVTNHFMKNYVYPMNKNYINLIQDTLNMAFSSELAQRELARLSEVFLYGSSSYWNTLETNYAIIANLTVTKNIGLIGGDEKFIKSTLDDMIANFNGRIQGAMANTQADVLSHVRTLQREMIARNKMLSVMQEHGAMESAIEREKELFRKNMLKKYPSLRKQLEEGKILKSRTYLDSKGNPKYKTYTLDDYTEMSVSETLKNVDRDGVEFVSKAYGEKVVEFYLRDNRHVEEANYACEEILKNPTIFGKHLLATSESAADEIRRVFRVKIWTIDRAKSEGSLNISWHCRHSIKRLDDTFQQKINKAIVLYDMTEQKEELQPNA